MQDSALPVTPFKTKSTNQSSIYSQMSNQRLFPRSKYIIASAMLLFGASYFSTLVTAQTNEDGEEYQESIPAHILPCLKSLPTLPRTVGKASMVVMDRGGECTILILFELQSDLDNYRRARIRSKLSPKSIEYKQPDGSVLRIKLELRRTAVW